ncbi:Geranylgeranyl pyrophosphate synthase [Actinobaculum suis]|uniref:Geranylgeranyl pyrophosphate synthase n=1 Tax=Actinobaculum suis TaxID=1657 RepID=A0A1G7BNC9_9ACTO|nr:polyprenyl synthetase family protein [Actinobaculum suis]MDY5153784.1 polyprenyl synthetase family protein [Actinobaculum suis]SDE28467.1 Geranylgeranyl pyrophosphate synthase [Actinobaculum suis]
MDLHLDEYRTRVEQRISARLSSLRRFDAVAGPASELVDSCLELARGGKRSRAVLVLAGFLAASATDHVASATDHPAPRSLARTSSNSAEQAECCAAAHSNIGATAPTDGDATGGSDSCFAGQTEILGAWREALARAGAGVELFHLAALIHDDLIDASPVRRGVPTVQERFADFHVSRGWDGSGTVFGSAIAVIAGDAVLAQACTEIASGQDLAQKLSATTAGVETLTLENSAVAAFNLMAEEVAYGQYLDLRAEVEPATDPIARAFQVIRYKTVSYSALYPLLIGARLTGASTPELEATLTAFAVPFGEAFQLRDDDLGIFGEPEHTGKPAAGDITEGKHTVLRALAEKELSSSQRAWLQSLQKEKGGMVALADAEVAQVRKLFITSGARDAHEALIAQREEAAGAALEKLPAASAQVLSSLLTSFAGRIY